MKYSLFIDIKKGKTHVAINKTITTYIYIYVCVCVWRDLNAYQETMLSILHKKDIYEFFFICHNSQGQLR